MLGEYGGLLKIMTTLVFFFYGFYSLRKVKSLMSGIIFKTDQEKEKRLEKLIGGKKSKKHRDGQKYNQVAQQVEAKPKTDSGITREANGPEYQKVLKHLIDRRSKVDNLMEKLNFLELIEKAVLQENAKTLLPLALLKAEKIEMEKSENQQSESKDAQEKEAKPSGRSSNTIFRRNQMTNNGSKPYKEAFDDLVSSNPNSQLGQDIKHYLVSLLEPTFKQQEQQPQHKIGIRSSQKSLNIQKKILSDPHDQFKVTVLRDKQDHTHLLDTPKTLLSSSTWSNQIGRIDQNSGRRLKPQLGFRFNKSSSRRMIINKSASQVVPNRQKELRRVSEFGALKGN